MEKTGRPGERSVLSGRARRLALFCLLLAGPGARAAGEALPSAEAPLGFDQALARIMERSTDVATQAASVESTRVSDLPAKLAFLPSLSAEARHYQLGGGNTTALITRGLTGTAKLNLFRFGADLSAIGAARGDEARQDALLEDTGLQTETAAVKSLLAEIQDRKAVAISGQIVQTQEETLRVARLRYKGGLLPIQEVHKISVDLDNARAKLRDAEIAELDARATLGALLGPADIVTEWPWRERWTAPARKALGDAALALESRPDWVAAKRRVEAEDHRVARARGLMLPSLDTELSYGRVDTAGQVANGWTGTLVLSVPVFNHLSDYAAYRAQGYTRTAAELGLEAVTRNATNEWASARRIFEAALSSAETREETLTLSRQLYQDNLRRFQSGHLTANDLAQDQSRLFDSELLAIDGWSGAHNAFTRLCHSLGRRVGRCL